MKNSNLIIIIIVLIVLTVIMSYIFFEHEFNSDAITNESTALAIGATILEENFPDYYEKVKSTLTAKRENDVWLIHSRNSHIIRPNNTGLMVYGGMLYVKLSAKDGTIIDIGIGD